MKLHLVALTAICGAVAAHAFAQIPDGAPAGSSAVCRDGTFYYGASKADACVDRGGLKQWWGVKGNVKPADVPAAAARGPYEKALQPVPTQPPTPGASAKVWADPVSKLYHCASDATFTKTGKSEAMSEANAKARGYMAGSEKPCI
jgi:hypothetical protein